MTTDDDRAAYDRYLQSPIFIMGHHRTGTTWLHQLLAETGLFAYISAYDVIEYGREPAPQATAVAVSRTDKERLAERFRQLGISRRVIDGVTITPEVPEEYGFILDNTTGAGCALVDKNVAAFRAMCAQMLDRAGSPRPILLKNPWDVKNFLFIKSTFPRARFIFIHRHPIRVINSFLHSTRLLLGARDPYLSLLWPRYERLHASRFQSSPLRAFFSPRSGLGLLFSIEANASANRYYLSNIESLPASDYVSVRYEDLRERPEQELARILQLLGQDPTAVPPLRTMSRSRDLALLPDVAWSQRYIRWRQRAYIERVGCGEA